MKYVIVGNGVASIGAIEGIRKHDSKGEILVLSEEDKVTYGRPLISYYLAGKVGSEAMALRQDSFFEKLKVTTRLGVKVETVDPKSHTVTLADGEKISYDKLLLATGGVPAKLPISGNDAKGVYTFTTWADADALKSKAETAKRFVVIGAGLIALKASEALAMRGLDVTLIVRSRIMRIYFDEIAGNMLVRHLESKGLKFLHGASPKGVLTDEHDRVTGVRTTLGDLPADAVIMATGVVPRMDLAEAAGLGTGRGIQANATMQTTDPDIYAAGDVVEARDMLTEEDTVTPIWPSAYDQGIIAGVNMAGANQPYPGGMAMNSITFFGLGTISIGLINPPDESYEVSLHIDEKNTVYRKLVFKDDKLVGCILIGDVDAAGVYNSFIVNGLEVTEEAKRELVAGTASPMHWPDGFFEGRVKQAAHESPRLS